MDDGGKCREPGKDKDREPEQTVSTVLVGWMYNNVYRENDESTDLVDFEESVT